MITVALAGMLSVTTQFAPIFTLFPTCILPIILAPAPIYTLSPISNDIIDNQDEIDE